MIDHGPAKTYYDTFLKHGFRRRFFIISKGNLGSGPADMKMEDLICILLGSKVLVVLRECDAGKGYYSIGTAYVHGIMHGEALAILALKAEVSDEEYRHLSVREFPLL